jgi:chromosome segregation ATPase
VEEFINYKLNNPQALQEEMKMIQDRQDCTRKLNEYSKQMENLKNEYNMCNELLEASTAKREYLQQTFQTNKEELDAKIVNSKE